MDQNKPKFRLRLNLFDGIVLLLALAVGAFLLWSALKPRSAPSDQPAAETGSGTVRYVVRFQRWPEGNSALVEEGDKLVDNIKKYDMGQIVSFEVIPTITQVVNHEERRYSLTPIEGYEDLLVTVESPCTVTDEAILLAGGYELRVGMTTYIRGKGYMASGPVISIEREGLE